MFLMYFSYFLNTTDMEMRTASAEQSAGCVPRWLFLANVVNDKNHTKNASAVLLILDSVKEKVGGFVVFPLR